MYTHHKFKVERTAHYHTIGEANPEVTRLIIACHGQGQRSQYFIRRFDVLDDGKTFVIAPEALSRYYLKSFGGEVGASWMTSAERLDEIADYANYLQQLLEHYRPLVNEQVKITLLGFSQGGATIFRWAMEKFPAVDRFILFASMLPEDLDYRPYQEYFDTKKITWLYGTSDQFLNDQRLAFNRSVFKKNNIQYEEKTFDGKHEVRRDVLQELFADQV
ncbi:alpha/beta hydrolase [Flavilitoribacter nigricans]|uniref:Phospholipase n=1 Tax=Flavilitoribacter nigricans (strain ATCC 23147 / DSM 23189 / NBRC 102662 / NCIMB 1420 / SS-2) TaxID=1122177 RepID=A0A2D0N1E4_FLAN2|nr:phospholipase [Flavilitoribacter nigricans]PHN02351.1 phospholipase [Flavilitoribacter nigricans DSM 23189 = NBRC 102662]